MTEREKLRSEIEEKIKRNYPRKSIFNSYILQSYLEDEIENHPNVDLDKKQFYRKNLLLAKVFSIFLFALNLGFIIYKWNEIVENPKPIHFVIIPLLLFPSVVSFIQGFVHKNEPVLSLNEDGLVYSEYKYLIKKVKEEILWKEIVVLSLWTTLTKGGPINKILIGKTNKEIVEVKITGLDTNPFEFITIIEKRINNNVA